MQATLRFNTDVSRQRAEAVRMAQEKMEDLRAFGVLDGSPGGEHDFAKIVTETDTPTTISDTTNTSYSRTTTVTDPSANDPAFTTVRVQVKWLDRRTASGGTAEAVTLISNIARVSPALGASLGLPGDRAGPQRPLGRHRSIPQSAVDQDNGTSNFTPPGAPAGATWRFVNATGQITSLCNPAGTCTNVAGWLLSGYIRFVSGGTSPTPALAGSPVGDAAPFSSQGVVMTLTTPASPSTAAVCYTGGWDSFARAYNCFIPIDSDTFNWSGRSELTGLALATNLADATDSRKKVCRYTPEDSDAPAGGNAAHPLDYTSVKESLTNQNFLVIGAGDGSVPFSCPDDDSETPGNTNTYKHQPRS
jgi:hypothetical protein